MLKAFLGKHPDNKLESVQTADTTLNGFIINYLKLISIYYIFPIVCRNFKKPGYSLGI